ncbi:gliding motility lipoprotein GldB [Schleiferia thermophila]|jgi:hypothetical protein|uniref:Protein involved in gliding motility GldB n=1 Tax=Schleiferia thermophila TaxID=884107 RepID=A0A369A276_9FLAO|nr:hypothetical protein [Schleiferia thermophila]RCX03309.1 protein involved in gliding motility GldB [Schleiferia thermophila]GCD80438.1 hypothetical protein JCM30197_16850 [Schleiferia thermophila]
MTKAIRPSVFYFISIVWIALGCKNPEKSDKKVELILARFEQDLYEIQPEFIFDSLPDLKKKYHPFFQNTNDEFWKNLLVDSLQLKLYQSVKDTFKDITNELKILQQIFENYNILFDTSIQKIYIYTYVSGLDFDYPVIFSDSLLFIGLDVYLGEDHPVYAYQPRYLARERNRKYIPVDAAGAIADYLQQNTPSGSESLINHMIRDGIRLYIMKSLLPNEKEHNLFKYTEEQIKFCIDNEKNLWLYFINNRLLFDTNVMTKKRFIDPAPFTRLGTDFDHQIPGRIGQWIGYRIVSQYMKNNKNITLKELAKRTDYQNIFNQSRYKP